jgi:hypothetical protein
MSYTGTVARINPSTFSVLFWFVISPPGTPVQQKCNFHSNKQQWRTQQLASTPPVCTGTRTSEETSFADQLSNNNMNEDTKQEELNQGLNERLT